MFSKNYSLERGVTVKMTKREMLGVDRKFKSLIEEISKKEQISQRETTRQLFEELTGGSMFKIRKWKQRK